MVAQFAAFRQGDLRCPFGRRVIVRADFLRMLMVVALPLLELQQLGCERDGRLLFADLSLTARPGELWQVSGGNGAGKTTLLRILAGLHGDFSGLLAWPAAAAAGDDPRQRMLMLGHRSGLRVELTALENLAWWLALHQCRLDRGAALLVLARLGLAGYETVPVAQLSAGQQRRVALSLLWLLDKQVWLLDEPFTALDSAGVALIEARLVELTDAGALVLFSSHHRLDPRARHIRLGQAQEAA